MPYSGRCGAFKCGFDKECAAKSLILNDLLMHDGLYLNLNLILTLTDPPAPLSQEFGVVQAKRDETRDSCLLAVSALRSRLTSLITSSLQ
jgi:hypothetical protein